LTGIQDAHSSSDGEACVPRTTASTAVAPEGRPDYFNRVNVDLLQYIPQTARVVVEFGCGKGALGAAYKRINPRCRWIGVELNAEAAAHAVARLDQVVVADAAAPPLDDLDIPTCGADCLIYGDVLEHLINPWESLARHLSILADNGLVLACVPNVQHWSILSSLLHGRFDYADEGLLDRTHLRFFTADSLRRFFESVGLQVHAMHPRVFRKEVGQTFVKALSSALPALGITDQEAFTRQVQAYQYIARAVRRRPRPLLLQAMTLKPVGAVNDVRILQPLRALASVPGLQVTVQERKATLCADTAPPDRVFLWQRPILTHRDNLDSIRRLLDRGYVIVTEFDDDPVLWPEIANNDHLTFKGVHAVQTSTPILADLLRQWNPEIAVFPNALNEISPLPSPPGPDAPLTLFFGALNREQDWAPLMPGLNRILAAQGEHLHVSVVHDRAFFEALETAHKTFTPTCDYPRYQALLKAADVALLPLRDTPFNRRKSDLKFIECGALGTVALASPVVYGSSLRDGDTGVLFDDPPAFEDRLARLLDDTPWREQIRKAAHAYVGAERLQAFQTETRLAWYRDLIARRASLTEALYQRVPALRP